MLVYESRTWLATPEYRAVIACDWCDSAPRVEKGRDEDDGHVEFVAQP